ncbi:MAG: LacI family transcriptional regulator [Acidimicrobiaceae bacterium]|nr:LacI family transcriptional regulator [Acidimicrobiaceae bacterium]
MDKRIRTRSWVAAATASVACASAALAAGAATAAQRHAGTASWPPIGEAGTAQIYKTVGPNHEASVPASTIKLTPSETAAVKRGKYTAALVWHEPGTFTQAVDAGAKAEFASLGMNVVSDTQANFDAATQTNQLQTAETLHPSVVLSLPVNAVTEASAYKQLSGQHTKLVLLSNVPSGFTYPADYAGMVTDDLANMGRQAAVLLGTAMHGKGTVGMIYYDADFYVTNERDASFRSWLTKLYPNIKIVAQQAMPNQSDAQTVATAMLDRHPNIQGIYVTYSIPPAEGVLAALRTLGKSNVKVVTLDLDPSIDANLATGKYLAGVVADQPYQLGVTMAKDAALAVIGKSAPRFAVVPAIPVTKTNLLKAWQTSLNTPAPLNIRKALK